MLVTIRNAVRSLGITANLEGFRLVCYALSLIVADTSRLNAIRKEIYIPTANHFGCDFRCVERNIRTAIGRAWKINPALLQDIAGYPMEKRPPVSDFLEIMTAYVLRQDPIK